MAAATASRWAQSPRMWAGRVESVRGTEGARVAQADEAELEVADVAGDLTAAYEGSISPARWLWRWLQHHVREKEWLKEQARSGGWH